MKDQHKLIKGYRDLTQEEINLINEIKEAGTHLEVLLKKAEDTIMKCTQDKDWVQDLDSLTRAEDHLKTGIMWLTRTVAKPKGF
jgi:hypothetical protein